MRKEIIMDETVYLNTFTSVLKNCQKPLREFIGDEKAVEFQGWILADMSLCKGLTIKMRVGRRVVRYNRPEKIIYINNLGSCVLNDAAGIINTIQWLKE